MANIPADAFSYNGHKYYIYSDVVDTWEEAEKYCESLGGHLAVITDTDENSALFNYMKSKGYDSAYFGFSDADNEGTWTWVNGEPVNYTNWEVELYDEPNGGTNENYGMFYWKYENGTWNDGNFGKGTDKDTKTFICEWDDFWKLSGTTAKYVPSNKTLVTVKGVKSTDGLDLNNKVVTVANSALNKKKVTVSSGYTLKLADDVPKVATKKAAWTLSGTTATYKSSYKTAGYTLASNKKSITYSKATKAETLATIKGVKSKTGLSVSGNVIKLKNSALNKKVTVSGGYEFDFASDYTKATITGSSSSDTITARGKKISVNGGNGNDVIKIFGSGTVSGGDGADIFYYKSSGANVISDYSEEDKISLASGNANVTISGDDVIFNDKITVTGGADKTVTYIENGVEKTFKNAADDVIYNAKGTAATLTAEYAADSFTPNEYSTYKNILVTIDASAVMNALEITGNKKSNLIIGTDDDDLIDGGTGADKILGNVGNDVIYGGAGNDSLNGGDDDDELYGDAGNDTILGGAGEDSLWGGKGSDTLYGGDGSDTFIYKNGDGKDIIADFDEFDTIMVVDAKVGGYVTKNNDVTFTVGNGQIVVQNAADKYIELVDKRGNALTHYSPSR